MRWAAATGGRRSMVSPRAESRPRTASFSIPRTAPRPSPFSCDVERGRCDGWFSGIRLACPLPRRSPCDDGIPHRRADRLSLRLRRLGHLNQAALLTLLERARWEALARGPGMDLFDRNGVWPAVRKAVIEYRAAAFARDVLRVETTVAGRGTTSMTLRHVVRRVSDDATVAEADIVFVCIDRLGRATPIPEEIARFLGPRTPVGGGHQPLRVPAGDVELAVDVRGEGVPVLFVHGFPFDRTVWRHQLAALSRVRRIAPDLRGVGGSGAPPGADGYSLTRYADDLVAVLDALGVRQAVVCGLSMGGYVIFELL